MGRARNKWHATQNQLAALSDENRELKIALNNLQVATRKLLSQVEQERKVAGIALAWASYFTFYARDTASRRDDPQSWEYKLCRFMEKLKVGINNDPNSYRGIPDYE